MRLLPIVSLSTSLVLALLATGCSSSFDPTLDAGPTTSSIGTISGSVLGGRQPISGAHVYLLQASTAGYGGRGITAAVGNTGNTSTSLLKAFSTGSYPTTIDSNGNYYVTTDAGGTFSITGEYNACTTGGQVYLYSVGGNPGGGVNSAAGLMAVLGTCGSFGSSTKVNMNEVSTVAAAYAFAGFATDATHVGTTGSALAKVDVANAFANANQLFDISSSPYNGTAYATSARATTPGSGGATGGTGTVPQKQINTLANILAACVNSGGSSSTQCNNLFADVKSLGASGTTASDTATEAIYIAQNPTYNVGVLYTVSGVQGPGNPYTPSFSSAPADYYVELTFTGAGLTKATEFPRELAVDASGNIWAVSGDNGILSAFSALGVPATSAGYATSFVEPAAIAIDNQGAAATVYVADHSGTAGTIGRFTASTGAAVNQYTVGASSNGGPVDLAIDGSGNIWSADYGANSGAGNLGKQTSTGTSTALTYANSQFGGPTCVAVEAGTAGNVYLADYNTTNAYVFSNASPGTGTAIANAAGQGGNGNAIDSVGTVWYANFGSVSKVTTGNAISTYTFGYNENSIAIDGGNNVWVTNADSGLAAGQVYELANVSGNYGGYLNTSGGHVETVAPISIAVDGSGDVWFNDGTDGALHELLGAAVPVATPLSYAVTAGKLGQQP